jgi:ferritin-like metal-binding protein YciE
MKSLTDLFLNSLAEIYYAENQLLRTLPKLDGADTDAERREAIEFVLGQTECYVRKVERVFAEFGRKARADKWAAITDLLEEGREMDSENKGLHWVDAALMTPGSTVENNAVAACDSLHDRAVPLCQHVATNEGENDGNGRTAAESESKAIRRHPSAQATTLRLRRVRYPNWPPPAKPILRGAPWKFFTGSEHCNAQIQF